jgi:Tol biopolymer transport system component
MSDHDDLDRRLRAYAARWRAEERPAPRVDGQTLTGTHRRAGAWLVVPAAAVAVALTILAVQLIARPDSQPSNPPAPQPDLWGIAFERGERFTHIWVMRADGSGKRQLTDDRGVGDTTPAVSPDGQRIAFSRYVGSYQADIYVMNADGSGVEQLTGGHEDTAPVWSPDGKRIAFTRSDSSCSTRGCAWVYVMNADGSEVKQLTDGGGPAWSPDGRTIAFVRGGGRNRPARLWVMNADGSGVEQLTDGPQFRNLSTSSPAWSPDGERIAFLGLTNNAGYPAIWLMNADGTDPTRLPFTRIYSRPTFSPDGKWLAIDRHMWRDPGIYAVRLNGSERHRLTTSVDDRAPNWSPVTPATGIAGN